MLNVVDLWSLDWHTLNYSEEEIRTQLTVFIGQVILDGMTLQWDLSILNESTGVIAIFTIHCRR